MAPAQTSNLRLAAVAYTSDSLCTTHRHEGLLSWQPTVGPLHRNVVGHLASRGFSQRLHWTGVTLDHICVEVSPAVEAAGPVPLDTRSSREERSPAYSRSSDRQILRRSGVVISMSQSENVQKVTRRFVRQTRKYGTQTYVRLLMFGCRIK